MMADYLSRFPSAAAPDTSHYDANFTVAKVRMIDEALYPWDQLKPRGQTVNKIQKTPRLWASKHAFTHGHPTAIDGNLKMQLQDRSMNVHKRAWLHAAGDQPIRNKIFENCALNKSDVVLSQLNTVASSNKIINFQILTCLLLTRRRNQIRNILLL